MTIWTFRFCAATWSHVDVHGLCCCWEPWWCLWSVLLLESMLQSIIHAITKGHINVCALCSLQKPCGSPWSLTVKGKEGSFAVVLMNADSWLRMRDLEGYCDNLYPIPSKERVYSVSHWKEVLKIVMLKCSSSQLITSARGRSGEGLNFL